MANYTSEQYTALVAAISQGAMKVKYADKEVEYRSLEEMLRLKRLMEEDLGLVANAGRGNTKFAKFSKGLDGFCRK